MKKGNIKYSIGDKRRALELYRLGYDGKGVQSLTGVGYRTVNRLAKGAGISRIDNTKNLGKYSKKNGMIKDKSANWRGGKTVYITMRDYHLRYRYGITEDDYNKMFNKQRGCCYLCGKHQSKLNYRLCVDHNHLTGKIRKLLCKYCNHRLGWYELNTKRIEEYVKL